MTTTPAIGAVLVRGDDPSLVAQAVRDVLSELLGDRDPSMVVEEHTELSSDAGDVSAIVDGLSTPPFLTDLRIIVVRDAGRIPSADAARIVSALERPAPGVFLVVAAGGGTLAPALAKAVERAGRVVDTKVGTGRARSAWLSGKLKSAPVKLDARAAERLGEHLGEDLGRLDGLVGSLVSAFGENAHISAADLEPFLGTAGGVPSWDLTDALDRGDSEAALAALDRMTGPSGSHPLVVLAMLNRHYTQMLRLDGSLVTSSSEAAEVIGTRSDFVARKALEHSKRLGSSGISRAVTLLSDADLDLRGRTGLPAEAVLQVLVARLSRIAPALRHASRRPGASRPAGSSRAGR